MQSLYRCMIEGNQEALMNEDVFNTSLRKFLKKVGILKGNEKLPAKMVLTLGGVNLTHEITDEIELG